MLDRLVQRTLRNLRRLTLDAILSVGLYSAAALGGMACDDSRNGKGTDYADAATDAGPAITCVDTDNDRFYATDGCGTPVDCDDYTKETNPNSPELCDYKDNNCNGIIDEDVLLSVYFDNDQDGFGDVQHMQKVCTLKIPAGYVSNHNDCDDTNALVNPTAKELCDLRDNNCNTTIDELCGCVTGETKQCGSYGTGECHYGQQTCNDEGVWNPCVDYKNPVPELCNGLDDDCDGFTDDGAQGTWYKDEDNDGFGNPAQTQKSCIQPDGYADNDRDCKDIDPEVHPFVEEICNEQDDDCNGFIDEGADYVYFRDQDNDGWGDPNQSMNKCTPPEGYVAQVADCAPDDGTRWRYIPGFVDADRDLSGAGERMEVCSGITLPDGFAFYDGDCDNNNPQISPYAFDMCNGINDDCDPETPDGVHEHPPLNDLREGVCANTFKACEEGVWQNSYALIAQYSVQELCDLLDNNCDGQIDELVQRLFYRDADGDSYGDRNNVLEACQALAGYVASNTDCDDRNPAVWELRQAYLDADHDSIGVDELVEVCAGDVMPDGYSNQTGDCEDGNARISPEVAEICDLIDNNCNGQTDEGVEQTYYLDEDGDGYGILDQTIEACEMPARLFAAVAGDCDDARAAVNPEAPEVCNSRDDDCNGEADEMGGLCEKVLFWDDNLSAIYVVNSDGTNMRSLTEDMPYAGMPKWRPDGRKISYITADEDFQEQIGIMNLDGSNKERIGIGYDYAWTPNGLEISLLRRQEFDGGSNIDELYLITVETGVERQITNHHQEYPDEEYFNCNNPSWNRQGTKVAYVCYRRRAADARGREDVLVYDVATQTTRPITNGDGNEDYFRIVSWAPDGQRLVYSREEDRNEENVWSDLERVYINDANRGNEQILPFNGWASWPRWSPAEDVVAFIGQSRVDDGQREGYEDIYLIRPDGGEAISLTNHQDDWGWTNNINWSADGRRIVYTGRPDREHSYGVYVLDRETGVNTDLLQQDRLEFRIQDPEDPVFSPLPPEEE